MSPLISQQSVRKKVPRAPFTGLLLFFNKFPEICSHIFTMSTELEKCMESLIDIFHRYAKEDEGNLSKKEFKKLIEAELPNFLQAQQNPNLVNEMMKDLDQNKDHKS
uniref:S100/CaBP-9k-type calcium binding subdomain domain-containing protein n=1 Tax=Knipowitschia caucasica TaxID=637954 RepID=A0AAV2MCU1_KNICA